MPYISVHVDTDDMLEKLSNADLERELERRRRKRLGPSAPEPWTHAGMVADLREAFYRRDANRLEALLAVLEQYEGAGA